MASPGDRPADHERDDQQDGEEPDHEREQPHVSRLGSLHEVSTPVGTGPLPTTRGRRVYVVTPQNERRNFETDRVVLRAGDRERHENGHDAPKRIDIVVVPPIFAIVVWAMHPGAGPTESSVMLPSSPGPETVVRKPTAASPDVIHDVAVGTSAGTSNVALTRPGTVVSDEPG